MLQQMIKKAQKGKNVYITDVRETFMQAENKTNVWLELDLIQKGEKKHFKISMPDQKTYTKEEYDFLESYVLAEVYNILSAIGGRKLTIYMDFSHSTISKIVEKIAHAFHIHKPLDQRKDYGNCINVIDRMIKAIYGEDEKFELEICDWSKRPKEKQAAQKEQATSDILIRSANDLTGKALCGIDIGGTDIKVAMMVDGKISCFKEYDWNPASFIEADPLVDPILDLTRLVIAYASLELYPDLNSDAIRKGMEIAMDKHATIEQVRKTLDSVEKVLGDRKLLLDGVGVSFPDVVVRDKIVGGETTKTRSMKRNPKIDYEKEFAKITDLDNRLRKFCKEKNAVKIINDGPMSAYTAAVELAVVAPDKVKNGVFAHSLGTEIGTGWVDAKGYVPEMPLECYNMIIDLGDFVEKDHPAEDVRSINNVNTGLAGTLQRYTSQGGAFRLAMEYFKEHRLDLYQELFDLGFVQKKDINGKEGYVVPTEPKDMRKGFLEHLMQLTQKESHPAVDQIFREIGGYMAITWLETEYLLKPECKERTIFGRLVKTKRCYELIVEGAKQIKQDIDLEVADSTMANTTLMKQLDQDAHYTVAQFAQAVGAIYYANQGLLSE